MLARIIAPFALVVALAGPAAADAVLVPGGSVSAGASFSASVSVGAGVTAVPVPTLTLRGSPYARPAVAVNPATPAPAVSTDPVPVERHPPVIRIQPRRESPFRRDRTPAPAPVVVPAAPVAVPTGTLHLRPAAGVRSIQLAPPPARMIVTSAPAYAPPPTVVVAQAPAVVVAQAPAAAAVAAPTCGCCECYDTSASLTATAPSDDKLDLMLFGNYRYLTDGSQVGGASLSLRVLMTDELSLEAGLGYLAGGTVDGRGREEVPTSLSLLWYFSGRDFPLYLGLGFIADWTNVWVDADTDGLDGNADLFRIGARAALGVEWQLLDTFVLAVEAETFVREAVDDAVCDAGPGTPACTELGIAANLGFGLRF